MKIRKLKEREDLEKVAYLDYLIPNLFNEEEHWIRDEECWCFCAGDSSGHELGSKVCLLKDYDEFLCMTCLRPTEPVFGKDGFPYEYGSERGFHTWTVFGSKCHQDSLLTPNGIEVEDLNYDNYA